MLSWAKSICGTIKESKSHVGNIQFWFFNINHLTIKNATCWSKPHLNWTSGYRDMDNSVKFKNNVKHRNLSPLLACNSKSIFPTSDSFPLIMSHIRRRIHLTISSKWVTSMRVITQTDGQRMLYWMGLYTGGSSCI